MARPLYILCAESGSEDIRSGLVSHYNVLEKILVSKMPEAPEKGKILVPVFGFRATAVWMRTEDDPINQEYEYEMALYLPPGDKEIKGPSGRFVFDPKKPLYRMTMLGSGPPFLGPGVFRVESRIRKVGTEEWLRQDYPIMVEEAPADAGKGNGQAPPRNEAAGK